MKPPRSSAAPTRPLVIATLNQKGGVGKSTTAASLGDEAQARGLSVLYVDADPQHTLMAWARAAAAHGRRAPRVLDVLEPHLKAEAFPGHDVVIIDCPGRLDLALRSALMVADLALVPCLPSPLDVWALKDTVKLVREGRRLRPELQLLLVLNKMGRSVIARRSASVVRGLGEPVAQTELGTRVTYAEALAAGAGPASAAPQSAAAGEIRALFDEVLAITAAGRTTWAASQSTPSR